MLCFLVTHIHTSCVEGLVSKVLVEHGHHRARVQGPPLQKEGGMRGGLLHISPDPPGFGVERVAPWLGLTQEVDNLGVATISEMTDDE